MKSFLIILSAALTASSTHAQESPIAAKDSSLPPALTSAEKILAVSDRTRLSDTLAAEAGRLLSHDDLFVQATAEWALSLKVGNENMLDQAKWPMVSNPDWFIQWYDIPLTKRIEMDWCRQAIAAGISRSPQKLITEIEVMTTRLQQQITSHALKPAADLGAKQAVTRLKSLARIAKGLKTQREVRDSWLAARRILRPFVFQHKAIDFDSLIFYTRHAPHHKANVCGIQHNGTYKPGGAITILHGLETAHDIQDVIGDQLPQGHIHGMDLHFNGEKIVFGYGKQLIWPPKREAHFPQPWNANWALDLRQDLEGVGLYEIHTDGTGLKRLTSHPVWSDTEPIYCPNDDIAFTSERSKHSPPCDSENNDITDTNLYLYQRNSESIRRLTNHRDVDMTPRLLNNGLIAYLHWEYQERHFNETHSIWTIRPDGTNADAYYKSHIPYPWALREVRSIPDTNKIVAIAAGHHCYSRGPIVVIDPDQGGNNPAAMSLMTAGILPQEGKMNEATGPVEFGGVTDHRGYYRNPYPISETVMLSSYTYASAYCNRHTTSASPGTPSNGFGLYLIDAFGNKELIFRDPLLCSVDVAPLKKRHRPHTMPDATSPEKNYATCIISNIYEGMAKDITPGTIKHLRIAQHLPTPLDASGRARKFAYGNKWTKLPGATRWTSVREIGLVPVEHDGSAHFKVPTASNASVYFQALDKDFMEVKRMRSSVSFQPGEVRSCTGCHETRSHAAPTYQQGIALSRPATMPEKAPWGYNAFDYETHVQPVLDRHCVSCHSGTNKETPIDLTATKVESKGQGRFNQSYHSLLGPTLLGIGKQSQVTLADRFSSSSVTEAMAFGSHASKLITTLKNGHHDIQLSNEEWYALVTWVDFNCVYHGKLINKNPADGSLPRRENYNWPDPWKVTKTPAFAGTPTQPTAETTLIVADPTQGEILRYSETGKVTWSHPAKHCHDLHVLESGHILFTDGDLIKEMNRKGRVIYRYKATGPIHSCERLENGFTLITDSAASCLIILNRSMQPVIRIPVSVKNKGILRACRGPRGTYLVAQQADHLVSEYDKNGKKRRTINFPGEVHSVAALENGNILIGGDGGIQIVDPQNKITWSLTSQDIPGVNVDHAQGVRLLPNGNILVPSALVEINRKKQITRRFPYAKNPLSPACANLTGVPSGMPSNGDYIVANQHAVIKFSADGKVLEQINTGTCHDIQSLPHGNLLFSSENTLKEINSRGAVIRSYTGKGDILSCRRLTNGQTVILDAGQTRLVLLDATLKELTTIALQHDEPSPIQSGIVRESRHGLVVSLGGESTLREYNHNGSVVRQIRCPSQVSAMAMNYAGDITVGGGFGLRRYSTENKLTWSMSIEDLPELGQTDIRSIQMRDNNNMILINRSAGPNSADILIEITEKKQIVRRFPPLRQVRHLVGHDG
ncbi:MAG: hypothetical protein KJO21_08940 [Verrucomicrobiae bacterium]|nr:hypothetical protein [Verrucomicrobiae bacterium]NNJ42299.1 hypothetical protein [Akkermansiaceae bacterium]